MLAKAAGWFEAQRREHLAVEVDYTPAGSLHSIRCRATPVIGRWEGVDAAGQMVRIETRDFIIAVADMPEEPKRGDRIVFAENGVERVYSVTVPDGSRQAWRWVDRNQDVRRIHAQQVERY